MVFRSGVMKRVVLVTGGILLTLILAAVQGEVAASAAPDRIQVEQQQAMEAVQLLAGRLRAELKRAMKEGGPVHAIEVCRTRARTIAGEIGRERGLHISRVSLKNRNPDNAPTPWEKEVLQDFERQKRAGRPVSALTYTTVVDTPHGRQFRFMKAIPTRGVCTMCHGEAIAPPVQEALDRLYPQDRARGFRPGDIRGAFVVTREMR